MDERKRDRERADGSSPEATKLQWLELLNAGKRATDQQVFVEIPSHDQRRFTMNIHCTVPGAVAIAVFMVLKSASSAIELVCSHTLGDSADAYLSIRAFIPAECPMLLVAVQTRAGEIYVAARTPVVVPMSAEEMAAQRGEIAAGWAKGVQPLH